MNSQESQQKLPITQLIYQFDTETGGGGITRFVIELGKQLLLDQFDVHVICLRYLGTAFEDQQIEALQESQIHTFHGKKWNEKEPYRSFWQAKQEISNYLQQNAIHTLHSHSEFTDILALIYKLQRLASKILRTVHYGHPLEWRKNPLRRLLLTNFLYPMSFDIEIGVSQSITSRLNERWMAHTFHRQARCIYNAIDLDRLANPGLDVAQARQVLGLPSDARIICSVGRLEEQKGFASLVDAAALVTREDPVVIFLIAGDGDLAQGLRSKVENFGLARQIRFMGPRQDIGTILRSADLFVSSSLWEGLPTVILEAISCGTPVLATSIPGTTEIIKHRQNGWLVPPADPAIMAKAIVELLAEPGRRQELAAGAREMIARFSIAKVAKEYAALYHRLYY